MLDIDVGAMGVRPAKAAGHGTDTLPAAASAVSAAEGADAHARRARGRHARRAAELAVPEQQRMLDTFAAQIALALERVHYVEIAQDALVNMESERLRNSLLSAISHDLRTPLTSIVGFASMLARAREPPQSPTIRPRN